MFNAAANLPAAKLINRVLSDYPLAGERLAAYSGARINIFLGPLAASVRVTANGGVEPVGEGINEVAKVTLRIPLLALPRLLKKDEAAYRQIAFEGDSEFAHLLSTIARNVEWDIEEDLSRLFGGGTTADIVSHRIVGGAKSLVAFGDDAGQRFTENVAEYLVHERNAFATTDELEQFTRENETLRDDAARLEARVNQLSSPLAKQT